MAMTNHDLQSPQRRAFLRRSGQLALTGTALPFALNLAAMGEAAAFNAPAGDYKALVCVFLFGGNDYANTLIPYDDTNYNLYSTIRGGGAGQTAGGIALAKSALTATLLSPSVGPTDSQGRPVQQRQDGRTAQRRAFGQTADSYPVQQQRPHNLSASTAAVFAQRPAKYLAVVITRGLHGGLGWQYGRSGVEQ